MKSILQKLSKAVLSHPDYRQRFTQAEVDAEWIGYPPATEAQITAAEKRLGKTLPPSYREFLTITNGWRVMSNFIDDVWSADKIIWLRDFDPQLIELWGEMDDEGETYIDDVKYAHMKSTLVISDWGDAAILLLNPEVINADGEWEAWFFANWNPGAQPFPSFGALLENQCESFLELEGEHLASKLLAKNIDTSHLKLQPALDKVIAEIRQRAESYHWHPIKAKQLEEIATRIENSTASTSDTILKTIQTIRDETHKKSKMLFAEAIKYQKQNYDKFLVLKIQAEVYQTITGLLNRFIIEATS